MAIEYKILRAEKGKDLQEIAQVAQTNYQDVPPEPGEYDYSVQAYNTSTGKKGEKTDRTTKQMYWAPDFVDSNIRFHLDAGREKVFTSVSLTDGKVDTWYDMSPNSNDATQGTAADRPDYDVNQLGSEPVVTFESGESLSMSLSQSPPYTFAMVFRQTATGTTSIVSGDLSVGKSSGSWSVGGASGGSANANWNILAFHVESSNSYARINGSEIASGSGGISLSSLSLGGAGLDIAEMICTKGVLPQLIEDGTRDPERLEGYLGGRWGLLNKLPNGHPYESEQPSWFVEPTQLVLDAQSNGDFVSFVKEGTNYFRMLSLDSDKATLEVDAEASPTTSDVTFFGNTTTNGLLTITS